MATKKPFSSTTGFDSKQNTVTGVSDPVGPADAANKSFATNADNLSTGTIPVARMPAFTGDAVVTAGTTSIALNTTGVPAGTYRSVAVDTKGRVVSGTNPTTLSGYGITDAAPSSHVGATGSAHGIATTSVAGFMSSSDKSKLDGIAAGAQVNTVTSVAGRTGAVTLTKSDVGLSDVDNTADSTKVVASAAKLQTARTINGVSFDGTQNIVVYDNTKLSKDGGSIDFALIESSDQLTANVSGQISIDAQSKAVFYTTITGATSFTVTNPPVVDKVASFILEMANGGAFSITWWAGLKWPNGAAPSLTASGRDLLGFYTRDGGTTWYGMLLGKDVK